MRKYLSDSIVYYAPSDASTLQFSTLRNYITNQPFNLLMKKGAPAYISKTRTWLRNFSYSPCAAIGHLPKLYNLK